MYNAAIRSSIHSVSTKSHIDDMIIPFYPRHEGQTFTFVFGYSFFFARLPIIVRRLGFCLINQDFVESSEVCEDDCTSILPCISGSRFKVFVVLSCLVIVYFYHAATILICIAACLSNVRFFPSFFVLAGLSASFLIPQVSC
jgi:hypothetical protein